MTDFNIDDGLDMDYRASDIDVSGCYALGDDIYAVSILSPVPVEYLGVAGDICFYFKSRNETWPFSNANSKDDCLSDTPIPINPRLHSMCTGRFSSEKCNTGYMPPEQAEELIRSCVALSNSSQLRTS